MLMESLDIVVEEPSPHPVLGVASIPLSPKANDVRAVVAPGIASQRTRPPAIERSKNSTAFEPIPTGERRNASPGE
jgi:hypothetical protein